ncbi:hypothetical protein BT63DRAFT_426553 [Microthyrium microscopicum]|uniref:Uncharacterized protein n=1 Tax=Microthyrium microscopicum TaxID=703497 RepID=A0A6A6U6B8_9PEZI|nr:hypothetical protein BT63DRAFT_426553 [Microthyrium microscopicum]
MIAKTYNPDSEQPRNADRDRPSTSDVNKTSQVERKGFRFRINSILPKLALPVAILVGCAITAGTTYALVRHVQHIIASAKVSSDPNHWTQVARSEAYDACYLGCNDCDDVNFAYNACAMTAKANVTGIICDGNSMWNWRNRYPIECLNAVGVFYKATALKNLKQSYRNQLAIIILTVLAGVLGALLTFKVWKMSMTSRAARIAKEETALVMWPSNSGYFPRPHPEALYHSTSTPRSKSRKTQGNRKTGIAGLFVAFTALFGKAHAYPCTGYDPVADQYFRNANSTIYGVVHGWYSDCYDYECNCITSCSTTSSGTSCSVSCSICTASDAAPSKYVNAVLSAVKACGFQLTDEAPTDVNVRVANPLIEKNKWVKISVNTFNITADKTDSGVQCLHDTIK